MKIIITENQNYLLRRVQQFINIVEDHIEVYELNEDGSWWCRMYNPDTFFENIMNNASEEFIFHNWDFFHDTSEKGGANMDITMLDKIVEEKYGNHIRNLFVRKCGKARW
jgi:hypothetical protein